MSDHYGVDGSPITMSEWASLRSGGAFEDVKRVTRVTEADCSVSTVWMGLNHQYGEGPPLIFETMVFGGNLNHECERWSTLAEARAGHEQMVDKVRSEVAAFERMTGGVDLKRAVLLIESQMGAHAERYGLDSCATDLYAAVVKRVTA